jgi:hypothetical protein
MKDAALPFRQGLGDAADCQLACGQPDHVRCRPDHDAADDLSGRVDPGAVGRVVRPCAGKGNVAYRIALTALFGYAISYLPLAVVYWVGFAHGPEVLLFGLIGAVPSAVCSWLAADRQATDLVPSP